MGDDVTKKYGSGDISVSAPPDASPLGKELGLSLRAVEAFFQSFQSTEYKASSSETYSQPELERLVGGLKAAFKATVKANEDDIGLHICFILLRAGQIQTSLKYKNDTSYSYRLSNTEYTVSDLWVRSTIARLGDSIKKKPNPFKCFCASFEDLYIAMAKTHPELFKNRTIGRRGTPSGYEYLSADFLSGCSPLLEDRERAVAIRASENALARHNGSNSEKLLISLYDL
ncbi:coat-like protein [Arracacha virus 1]|uniref:Coat-like protein n=1 Tax=Arracacha virus 1 TaxID=2201042 RepID=A0A2U8JHA4_9CLOS|nr:coat-like protein [Arracacha virus 1]AWK68097.1 coat-like protein [Arracacha virus 1]